MFYYELSYDIHFSFGITSSFRLFAYVLGSNQYTHRIQLYPVSPNHVEFLFCAGQNPLLVSDKTIPFLGYVPCYCKLHTPYPLSQLLSLL